MGKFWAGQAGKANIHYARPMRLDPIRLSILTLTLLGLCACERETYTSWSCRSDSEMKIAMVLRKAQMEFKDLKFDYCGSLGKQSYFDQKCPALIQESSYTFTPSSGSLISKDQEYQCGEL
jgi:hypothetical protein